MSPIIIIRRLSFLAKVVEIPFAVLSYARPVCLSKLVDSIMEQRNLDKLSFIPRFILFQDFYSNEVSQTCISHFKKLAGRYPLDVFDARENLGVFNNFRRAEKYCFSTLGADNAVFLEDDLVLGLYSLQYIHKFIEVLQDKANVGSISFHGISLENSQIRQESDHTKLVFCDEHRWGFIYRKEAYQATEELLKEYNQLMASIKYRSRNSSEHKERIAEIGRRLCRTTRHHTSQDSFKNLAFARAGFTRLCLAKNLGYYLGYYGEHSTLEKFRKKHAMHADFADIPPSSSKLETPDFSTIEDF